MMRFFIVLLMLVASGGKAACTLSIGNGAFGTLTSFAVSGSEPQVAFNLVVECDTILNLLTNDAVTLNYTSASFSTGSRAALRRTDAPSNLDAIPVRLCGQQNCSSTTEVTTGQSYTWSGNTLLTLLTSRRYTLPLYLRLVGGQSVSAGPYRATLNFSVSYSVCSLGISLLCTTAQTGTRTLSTQVDLTVTNDCITINAPNVNFGSAPMVRDFPVISQSVGITCTKGSNYTVGINNGSWANGNVRNMAFGTNRLSYDIYKGSTTNRWGSTGAERWDSAGSSAVSQDGLLRTYNYTARILGGQTTPPVGDYSDTLLIDIAF
ncbi:spore coat U domain-containing protein [Superficieibacter sp. HKU1]|uniref:Csu type fimbrial protein n=1 Tax=Superficieibacter sp. HKU1 TaxID=3031919 RepID=UPI0023E1EBAE|nr:spore coat U domain-containing protein [Superficieibacter sp. HKU1]WES66600.1 spore coat U domain-containing protein [Superficieibacter sp. HKU1]